MRALIYARVSLDPQGQGRSVTEQLDECRAWAKRENWTITQEITETGSASSYARSTKARTKWHQLTTAIASGNHDILITWEASRATRQLTEYAELAELCQAHNVLWGYSGTIHDLNTRDARFRTGLDALLAADESARTSERIQRSVRKRAATGAPHGKLPYGYRREYDPHTGALQRQIPDETTAPIVHEICTRVAAGEPYYSIARDLTRRSIPIPRPVRSERKPEWISSTVKGIATNPTYAALRVHKGEIVGPAQWPPIIPLELHEQILAIAEHHRANSSNIRGDSTARHLLTGIARCGHCGGTVRRIKGRKNSRGERYEAYNCKWCLRMSREMTNVDTHVTARLLELLAHIDAPSGDQEPQSLEVEEARKAVDTLQARLDEFVDEATTGNLSAASLARVEARLLPQLDQARARLRAAQVPPALSRYDLSDPQRLWDGLDIHQRRELIRAAVTVTLEPVGGPGKQRSLPAGYGITVRPNW